mmetsp:Transcript_41396/g.134730  ORF Transcript_41396/g.134730 Transcript_41396/m.134730 type:complete len:248 (+) Transcript_41396:450-1193(+)
MEHLTNTFITTRFCTHHIFSRDTRLSITSRLNCSMTSDVVQLGVRCRWTRRLLSTPDRGLAAALSALEDLPEDKARPVELQQQEADGEGAADRRADSLVRVSRGDVVEVGQDLSKDDEREEGRPRQQKERREGDAAGGVELRDPRPLRPLDEVLRVQHVHHLQRDGRQLDHAAEEGHLFTHGSVNSDLSQRAAAALKGDVVEQVGLESDHARESHHHVVPHGRSRPQRGEGRHRNVPQQQLAQEQRH